MVKDNTEIDLEKLLARLPEKMKSRVLLKTVPAGETIIKKSEEVRYVHILLTGEARITNEFPNGERYIFAQMTAVNFIGEVEIMAGEKEYSSNVESVTACKVLLLRADDFVKWIQEDSYVLLAVTRLIARKLYLTAKETGTVKFFSGIHKLKTYLINYCHTIKDEEAGENFLISRNRQQIADEIGTSVKTVNRGLSKLSTEGLLSIKRGKIYISTEQYAKLHAALGIL